MVSLIDNCCSQASYWTKGFHWFSWNHHFELFVATTMIWITVTEYMCHKMTTQCSDFRNNRICINEAGTVYLSEAEKFTPCFGVVHIARSLVLCVVFCRSLFVLFLLAIVLSVLRYTASDRTFCIFKLFSRVTE